MDPLNTTKNVKQPTVELRAAKIPWISLVAVHYWFEIYQDNEVERWEVWQKPEQRQPSWGHVHLNLLRAKAGVGCGESWVEGSFTGGCAQKLIEILRQTPQDYPYQQLYRYWPGPNSNTYVQWVLNQADITQSLKWRGIGKSYLKWV